MKSLHDVLLPIAVAAGLAGAFLLGRASGKAELSLQERAEAPPARVEPEKPAAPIETVEVVVAGRDLPVGTLVDEDDLKLVEFPKASLPPEVAREIDDVVSKRLVRTLRQGDFFTVSDVTVDRGIMVLDGLRMYALKANGADAVAGFVLPGSRIDIIVSERTSEKSVASQTIVGDVLVLAVDTVATMPPADQLPSVGSITVAVTSEQAKKLSAAKKRGELRIALHQP